MFSRKFKQMQKEMADSTKKTAQEGKQAGEGFASWSSDIVKASVAIYAMHAPIKAIQTAAAMVNEEIANTIRLASEYQGRQVPYQQQLMNMMFNLPANEDAEMIKTSLDRMVKESKIGNKDALLKIVESAASSTVDMPYLERAKIAIDVAESRPDLMGMDQPSLEALTKAVVYNQKAFADMGSTTQAQQGMLQAAKSAALVQDNALYFNNLGMLPGQIRNSFGKQYGQAELLAFISALNIASGDTQGNITSTQTANFFSDLTTKLTSVPEMKGKTLNEQLSFLRSADPRAGRIRGELLAAMEERDATQLSEEDRMILELADLGDEWALKQLKDKPDLTGRSKSKFALMQMIQPEGAKGDGSAFNMLTIYNALLHGSKESGGMGELPMVVDAQGRVDEAASYRKAEELLKSRIRLGQDSPEFRAMNLENAVGIATEKLSQEATKESFFGIRDKVIDTLIKAGGSATYYKNDAAGGAFSPYRWRESFVDMKDDKESAEWFKQAIKEEMFGVLRRKQNEVTPVYPDWISKAKGRDFSFNEFEFFDYDRLYSIKTPTEARRRLMEGGGELSEEYRKLYGLSDDSAKTLKTLYDLYQEIDRLKKVGSGSELKASGGTTQGAALPQVQLDEESKRAVRQVFESVSMLMGFLAPALSGEKPLAVKDANKPRTEPAKGDWAP
jgi:hypothetical protein